MKISIYVKYVFGCFKSVYVIIRNRGRVRIPVLRTLSWKTIFDCDNESQINILDGLETTGETIFQAHGGKITIAKRCYFNSHCIISCRKKFSIGEHCLFGPNVCIYDHDHVFTHGIVPYEYNCNEIIIEDNCWTGAGAIILKGSKIGQGSVAGAGAVIAGIIPPNTTVIAKQNLRIYNHEEL